MFLILNSIEKRKSFQAYIKHKQTSVFQLKFYSYLASFNTNNLKAFKILLYTYQYLIMNSKTLLKNKARSINASSFILIYISISRT